MDRLVSPQQGDRRTRDNGKIPRMPEQERGGRIGSCVASHESTTGSVIAGDPRCGPRKTTGSGAFSFLTGKNSPRPFLWALHILRSKLEICSSAGTIDRQWGR